MVGKRTYDYGELMKNISLLAGSESSPVRFLEKSMQIVGEELEISKIYCFEYSEEDAVACCNHQWTAGGEKVESIIKYGHDLSWIWKELYNRSVSEVVDTSRIEDHRTRKYLQDRDIKSLMVVPIISDGNLVGAIGFSQSGNIRKWTEQEKLIIQTIAIIYAHNIKEKRLYGVIEREHEQLLTLVDNLGGVSYAVDFETYEIVFANNELKKSFDKELIGRKCYKEFQNRDEPCEFCTNKYLEKPGDVYEWNYFNEILQREFHLIDRLIEMPTGRKVRFEMGFDITSLKDMERQVRQEKELLNVTLMSLGEGVISVDQEGYIKTINRTGELITGWKMEKALGRNIKDVFKVRKINHEYDEGQFLQELLGKAGKRDSGENIILKTKNCEEKYIAGNISLILGEKNTKEGEVIVFRDMTESLEKEEKLKYFNTRDSLTGLYNRTYFEELLKGIDIEDNYPIGVIIGDLNGLKMTNDAYGHQEGDRIIKETGRIIAENCEEGYYAARWGGDEFVIISKNTCEKCIEDKVKEIMKEFEEENQGLHKFSISLGYAVKNSDEESLMSVFKKADDAMYTNKYLTTKSVRNNILSSMQKTLQEISHETEEHAERLEKISYEIGRNMKLSTIELNELKLLAVLHDIGKVAVKQSIINKTEKLTEEEWNEIKRHPEIGCRIVQSVPELAHIGDYILYHHERWDGNGYPVGLSGEEIPLLSRIISVADAYDAMTNDRSYRKALTNQEAVEQLIIGAGKQFDPEIVGIFLNKVANKEKINERIHQEA